MKIGLEWIGNHFVDLKCRSYPIDPRLLAEAVYPLVWRRDFKMPGFALVDLGTDATSIGLRSLMVNLKRELSQICQQQISKKLIYQSMGRFDQQNTTRFHRDNAPDESLLMLGYEPSDVQSRLFMADYSLCAHALGMTPADFLRDYNPMYQRGEDELRQFSTELIEFKPTHYQIVLVNNSSAPYSQDAFSPQGVLHKAEILTPDNTLHRVVNSAMLSTAAPGADDIVTIEAQVDFTSTSAVSQRNY
jgi:hypothetical protein